LRLTAGESIGPYEIQELLGAGGMGEVYRATDPRLGRDVAIKVLPEAVSADPQTLARFQTEARAVAALSHPNIVALYDIGQTDRLSYVVMELLEGESLAERMRSGPIPVRKAMDWAVQVARGLAAAHEKGIVHRDLKPQNLFLTGQDRLKILDFGLARQNVASEGETVALSEATAPGAVLGTVGYMSPEQVRGQPVDARGDIFSFGAVLYELLTGRRAFEGDTSVDTMSAILHEEVADVSQSGRFVPPMLSRIVQRCLEKDPEQRFQSARDLAFAIEAASQGSASGVLPDGVDLGSKGAARVPWGGPRIVAVLLLTGLLGAALAYWLKPAAPAPEPARVRTLTFSGRDFQPSASPDERLIAFTSDRDGISRIWIKQLASGGEQPLTAGSDVAPRFSPDGSEILFLHGESGSFSAYRTALVGGQPRRIMQDVLDADWSPDGRQIAFHRIAGDRETREIVGLADVSTGQERVLTEIPGYFLAGLRWSPDGHSLLTTRLLTQGGAPTNTVLKIAVDSGKVTPLQIGQRGTRPAGPAWTPDGRIVLAVSPNILGDLTGVPSRMVLFDPARNTVQTLFWARGINPLQVNSSSNATIDVLKDETNELLHVVDLNGTGDRTLTTGLSVDRQPVYSPDGKSILFSSSRSGNLDLWIADVQTGALTQLTDDAAQDWDPAFSPGGDSIVFSSDRTGNLEIWMMDRDGGNARQVSHDGEDAENPGMTPDGRWIVYASANPVKLGIWKVHPDGTEATRLAEGNYTLPEMSHDGRYIVFVSSSTSLLSQTDQFLDLRTGTILPLSVPVGGVSISPNLPNVAYGRARWMPDGKSIAFVGYDDRGTVGIYQQDFDPQAKDTSASRRRLVGFVPGRPTESLGISPDGGTAVVAYVNQTRQLKIAENVAALK
jgi:Tol biopolymer transport system component